MPALEIFKLVAASLSAGAAVYGMGHMLYVALTAPTQVRRINHVTDKVAWQHWSYEQMPSPFSSETHKRYVGRVFANPATKYEGYNTPVG
jgi:hypothetical protein